MEAATDNPNLTHLGHESNEELSRPGVNALLVVYGAAHHNTIIKSVLQVALKYRLQNRVMRLVIAACGHSKAGPTRQQIVDSIREAGIDEPFEANVFANVERYKDWLAGQLQNASLASTAPALQTSLPSTMSSEIGTEFDLEEVPYSWW